MLNKLSFELVGLLLRLVFLLHQMAHKCKIKIFHLPSFQCFPLIYSFSRLRSGPASFVDKEVGWQKKKLGVLDNG